MSDSKQVKVDNWGIFFLQRLQTFFNRTYFCDLTLQFEDNVQLKVHRLVMNACTEYFQVLEQTCEVINDCLIMPPDLQADVVVPIVNFMYTGILEFQASIFHRLYETAKLMNMTVLTKLLDAQKVPISPIPKPMNKRMTTPITWNLQGKKIAPKTMDPDLPEPLPGRKLPIWKRKMIPTVNPYRSDFSALPDPLSQSKYFKTSSDEPPKPTRFEWPEEEETNFESSYFDQISYSSKPLQVPKREKSPKPSTSSNFEELKRTSSVKRPASPAYNDSKRMNIQDVKEYIKEQKLRSDYIDYDDSEAADNDLQTYQNDDTDDENAENSEERSNKSILKSEPSTSHNKRVRFSLEGKENAAKLSQKALKTVDMTNHTKIITEVLKKYPHLVKKNKNIKLKILAKGANVGTGIKPIGTPIKNTKSTTATKVSYMVMKPGENPKVEVKDTKKDGHWSCHKCSNPNPLHFETYYLYRKHLTDVHNEKTDSQMCNICGHVSRKQNMLVHHKLVKHNITPPPSYHFPKCKDCSYIALSSAMLVKHNFTHSNRSLNCAECNTNFITRTALISHIQLTGHTDKNNCPTYDCTYCTKKFISDETLLQHIKNNHREEARKDNLISPNQDEAKNVITAEEIDALEEPVEEIANEKPKEKIKILSDVKVTNVLKNKIVETKLEPSSEAESLSNVASGIATSLGLANTIIVLDENNQFILQNDSQDIIPDNLTQDQQVITTDANTIISQAGLNKNNITSTDELVMVLTDHDYSDATNNTVITSENSNIVVLYSHPVQGQDGQFIPQQSNLMINSDTGLVEIGSNYAISNSEPQEKPCEESIELIQQELDNHVETEPQEKIEETIQEFEEETVNVEEIEHNVQIPKEMLAQEEKMEVDEEVQENQQTIEEKQQNASETNIEKVTENQEIVEEPENQETIEDEPEIHEIVDDQPENEQIIEDQLENQQIIEDQLENQQIIDDQPSELDETTELQKTMEHQTNEEITSNQETVEHQINEEQTTTEHQKIDTETEEQEIIEVGEENQEIIEQEVVKTVENQQEIEIIATETTETIQILEESQNASIPENVQNEDNNFEEPMEIEESIEMIQQEIHSSNNSIEEILEDSSPNKDDISPVELKIQKALKVIEEKTESQLAREENEAISEVESEKPAEIEYMEVDSSKIPQNQEKPDSNSEIIVLDDESETTAISQPSLNCSETEPENTENSQETEKLIDTEEKQAELSKNTTDTIELPEEIEAEIQELLEPDPEPIITPENSDKLPETAQLNPEVIEIQDPQNIDQDIPEKSTENKKVVSQEITKKHSASNSSAVPVKHSKISNLLDDWDDGDTDSQQSPKTVVADTKKVVNTLINDWEDEEDS